MSFDDLVGLSIPLIFVGFLVTERLIGGGRGFAKVRLWTLIGFLGLLVSGAASTFIPLLLTPWLGAIHLIDLSGWGLYGAIPAVVLTTFFTYWTHRIQHRFDLLWRVGHQLHHGVVRVDIGSSMIFHPIDLLVQVTATSVASALLGITPHAAGLAGVAGFVIALFQHWNIATPQWAGYLIQRPEAHCLHHERDVHARNFGDLPVWDMLFGTFVNPKTVDVPVGFEPERSRRWLAMICCVDVNRAEGRTRL